MAKNKKKYSKKRQAGQKAPVTAAGYLLPIIFCIGFVPLIVFYHSYKCELWNYGWFDISEYIGDLFLYFKMVWFVAACIFILFCILYWKLCSGKALLFSKSWIPLLVYAVLTILSTFTSISVSSSLGGIWEQFEPVWVLLGYCILVYYVAMVITSAESAATVLNYSLIGVALVSLIGLTQAAGQDFFATKAGYELITPASYTQKLSFNFEPGRVYTSLYNPNYVGSYVALILPVLITLFVTTKFEKKTIWKHVCYILLFISLLICLFASQSRSGILSLGGLAVIFAIFMRKHLLKHWKISCIALAGVAAVFIVVNIASGNVLLSRLSTMFTPAQKEDVIRNIYTNNDNVTMEFSTGTLVLTYSWNADGSILIHAEDDDGKELSVVPSPENPSQFVIEDSRFDFLWMISSPYTTGVCVYMPSTIKPEGFKDWHFSHEVDKDGTYYAIGSQNKYYKIVQPEYVKFLDDHTSLFNNRGYIWSRTLPLLSKYFFLGSGPDTFSIAFPNQDEVGLYNGFHDCEIVTKPHNWFLQTAVQTGVPSLIALLVFLGIYFFDSIRLYWHSNFTDMGHKLGFSIFLGTFGYVVTGIINDSTVTVAPAFWGILGLGIAMNRLLQKQTPVAAGRKKS